MAQGPWYAQFPKMVHFPLLSKINHNSNKLNKQLFVLTFNYAIFHSEQKVGQRNLLTKNWVQHDFVVIKKWFQLKVCAVDFRHSTNVYSELELMQDEKKEYEACHHTVIFSLSNLLSTICKQRQRYCHLQWLDSSDGRAGDCGFKGLRFKSS